MPLAYTGRRLLRREQSRTRSGSCTNPGTCRRPTTSGPCPTSTSTSNQPPPPPKGGGQQGKIGKGKEQPSQTRCTSVRPPRKQQPPVVKGAAACPATAYQPAPGEVCGAPAIGQQRLGRQTTGGSPTTHPRAAAQPRGCRARAPRGRIGWAALRGGPPSRAHAISPGRLAGGVLGEAIACGHGCRCTVGDTKRRRGRRSPLEAGSCVGLLSRPVVWVGYGLSLARSTSSRPALLASPSLSPSPISLADLALFSQSLACCLSFRLSHTVLITIFPFSRLFGPVPFSLCHPASRTIGAGKANNGRASLYTAAQSLSRFFFTTIGAADRFCLGTS